VVFLLAERRGSGMRGLMTLVATIVVCLTASAAAAQTLSFFGDIGGAPVFVELERTGEKLSGSYIYLRQPQWIALEGRIDAGGVTMDESIVGAKTGSFKGRAGPTGWSGTWRSPNGRTASFSLRPERGTLSDLDGRLQCKTSKAEDDYTFSQSLDLRASRGRLSTFSYATHTGGKYGPEDCAIQLGNLQQLKSELGILLRATEDDPDDTSEDAMHCNMSIDGDSDHLVLRVRGCKGAGGRFFCSGNGSWADLIVSRKTKICRAME